MAISAKQVAQLRQMTGAGMMECKKFLEMTDGDIDKAITEMRKAGQAKADKKAGRIAADGVIVVSLSDNKKRAVMLEVNSETDFVARDDNFVNFANQVVNVALSSHVNSVLELNNQLLADGQTVEESRQQLVAKVGENIQVRRMVQVNADNVIGCYLHGSRIGVLASMKKGDDALAKDIAMHIAASKPLVVNSDQVPAGAIENEREIYAAQARDSGKPEEIIARMIEGRLNKFIDEVSLLGQPFVKDPNKKISQLLKEKDAEVERFVRFEVGEGIEVKEDDFVEEVMAQVRDQ